MEITVYGPGCPNCKQLAENAKTAAEELGIEFEIKKIEDSAKIVQAGVMNTPGLEIEGEIVVKGRVPDKEEIKDLLQ